MTFDSKQDVLALMQKMKIAFDAARDEASDRMDSATYQNLTYLAGSLINFLNSVALRLPSIVNFSYQQNYPSYTLANLIYQDASRSEELISENQVVHPLFMPRQVIGLSS
jgi:prophage DNA circulation protein